MKRTLFVLVVLVAPSSQAAPIPKDRTPYFATKKGDKWVSEYVVSATTVEITEVVTGVEKKGDALIVTTAASQGGRQTARVTTSVSDKGIYLLATDLREFEPPACRLRLPVKPGDKWSQVEDPRDNGARDYRVVGEEEVDLPTGKTKAVRIDVKCGRGAGSIWYAQGVGPVKSVWESDGITMSSRLKSFTPAKE